MDAQRLREQLLPAVERLGGGEEGRWYGFLGRRFLHGDGQHRAARAEVARDDDLRRPGARVLVVARGSIGLYVCDIARALGASDILYVDPDPEHRKLAEGYGARTAETLEAVRHGFDLAVEATGRVDQLALAVGSLAPEGICESAGNHFRPGELPLLDMYLTGVTLRIARDNVRAHIPDALDLARSGQVDPARVVSHVLDWEHLPDALPEKPLKPVFVRGDA